MKCDLTLGNRIQQFPVVDDVVAMVDTFAVEYVD